MKKGANQSSQRNAMAWPFCEFESRSSRGCYETLGEERMSARDEKRKLDELSDRVLADSMDALKKERCPQCGGSLKIRFDASRRGLGSVGIDCAPCRIRIRLDGVQSVPEWAIDSGYEIST